MAFSTPAGLSRDDVEKLRNRAAYGDVKAPDKKKKGRPTLYTQARADLIIKAIEQGFSVGTAANAVGIHRDTIFDWLQYGEALEKRLQAEPELDIETVDHWDYLNFLYRYREARSDFATELEQTVKSDAKYDAEMAWRLLTIRYPADYQPQAVSKVDMTLKGDSQNPLQVQHSGQVDLTHQVATTEEQRDYLTAFMAALQEAGLGANFADPATDTDASA